MLIGLTIFEVSKYMTHESQAELVIDMTHRDDFVNINLDVSFPKVPCDVLSVDVEDILGTHKTDVMGELHKDRLDKSGVKINEESMLDKNGFRGDMMQRVLTELKAE